LIVSPPVGNFAQVHPAICLLTRYLRAAGIRTAQRDLAIDCFHYYHSSAYLGTLAGRIRHNIAEATAVPRITGAEARRVSNEIRLGLLLDRTRRAIDRVKQELSEPAILDDPKRLADALKVLRDVGRIISALHPTQRFNFQEFRIEGAFDDWDSLRAALQDPAKNLLLSFLDATALPSADLLGLSVTYPDQFLAALCVARRWRRDNPSGKVVVGGSYVTQIKETFRDEPRWFDLFDFLVCGDGEDALLALASAGGCPSNPSSIPNLWYREGERVCQSKVTARTNLSGLPVPMLDFDGIDQKAYVAPYPVVALPISRGCYWGKCTFCNISNQADEAYRVRSVAKVVEDIAILREEVGTSHFDFCVDSYHPEGLARLSRALVDAGLGIFWNAEVLLDSGFDHERLSLMYRSGCRHLRFGLESVNQRTLLLMNKRNDLAVIERILRDCNELGIKVSLMSIIGFPTETEVEAWNTIKFYRDRSDLIAFVTLHEFNVSAGSPIMQNPSLCNIELVRQPGLLQPRFRYHNNNVNGMSAARVAEVVPAMEEAIRFAYPQHSEIHTVGIGGWLTFLACCRHDATFFKREIVRVEGDVAERGAWSVSGGFCTFEFDVGALEAAVGAGTSSPIEATRTCVLLSADGDHVHVLSARYEGALVNAFASSSAADLPDPMFRVLSSLGLLVADVNPAGVAPQKCSNDEAAPTKSHQEVTHGVGQ
jgi:radical SAM superfamily enzyme YgiQ (UPF0313 family)